jgi:lysyl-tRNA synthetase class 2
MDQKIDTSDQFAVRKAKLEELRQNGFDPFAANWEQSHTSAEAIDLWIEDEENSPEASCAGRLIAIRKMGKASFARIQDRAGTLQLYFKRDVVGEEAYADFKKILDLGDFIGVRGTLFKTKTGEVTLRVLEFKMVSKAMRPLPEKYHGLTDDEQIYRQRYLDLISNNDSRDVFLKRSAIIRSIRNYLESKGFMEAETPILKS